MDHIQAQPPAEDDPHDPRPGGGWLSGASVSGPGGDIVSAAITALQAFGGGIDRYQAANLLNIWARRGELSTADRAQVLDHFGADR